ncbi:hypothetical protein RJ641_027439, partial [Dillenia turbinata]
IERMKRLAVLVGCNYPNTKNELKGCINDAKAIRDLLIHRFGFSPGNIELLTDEPGRIPETMPTGANIKQALKRMVDRAEPGDVLFFHYSGHGTLIPSLKPIHPFRQDEAIVPCDFNLITDVDFRQLINNVPKGATFTILSDSCHSGGLIDKEKEQIGPSSTPMRGISCQHDLTPKTIPLESIIQHLSTNTGVNTSDVATHLLYLFGELASLSFLLPHHEQNLVKSDMGILLSGCQKDETSSDVIPNGREAAYGAFSNAIQTVVKEHGVDLSNRQLVMLARKVLKEEMFAQHPCLYCSDANADATFLGPPHKFDI